MWKHKEQTADRGIKVYKGFPVHVCARGKLVPWDDGMPDCMCELLLTELYLYVLEDNFDRTYTEHYVIPVKGISFLGITTAAEQEGTDTSDKFHAVTAAVIGVVTGIYYRRKKQKEYFRIDYLNDCGNTETIFFEDLNPQIEKLIEKWKKNKR